MKVCGVEIEEAQVAACEAVLTRPFFDINTVTQVAREAGIAESIRVKGRLGCLRLFESGCRLQSSDHPLR